MKKLLFSFCLLLSFQNVLQAQNNSPYWSLEGNSNASGSSKLGTTNNNHLRLFTNNSERMRLSSAGLIGIGTTSPNAKLHINSTSDQIPLRVQVNGSSKLIVQSNGTVAIGTTAPNLAIKLEVINASGNGIYTKGADYGLQSIATSDGGYGVYGSGKKYGVYGFSSKVGVDGYGPEKGVFGHTITGKGVNGYSEQSYGGFFESYDGTALYAKTYNGFYAALFYGNTFSSGTYYGSDKNIKKNIREVGNATSLITKLKPRFYEFRDDAQYAGLHLPKGNHYGFLAQDVEEILPNLVRESVHEITSIKKINAPLTADNTLSEINAPELKEAKENISIKAVNYIELIPIMVKAMQEQEAKLNQQQQAIKNLTEEIARLKADKSTGNLINQNKPDLLEVSLAQNEPNPVNLTTTFRYTIPAGSEAQISIFESTSGKLLKTLSAPATGQVQLSANDLKPGTYIYTLLVNGKLAASKQMIIAD